MAKLCALSMLWAARAAAQTVEGRVIDSVTGSGIPGATVELIRLASTTQQQTIDFQALDGKAAHVSTTDAQGRFRNRKCSRGCLRRPLPQRRILESGSGRAFSRTGDSSDG